MTDGECMPVSAQEPVDRFFRNGSSSRKRRIAIRKYPSPVGTRGHSQTDLKVAVLVDRRRTRPAIDETYCNDMGVRSGATLRARENDNFELLRAAGNLPR